MSYKDDCIRYIRLMVQEIEDRCIDDESLKIDMENEEIDITAPGDVIRHVVIGGGRILTVRWSFIQPDPRPEPATPGV